MGHSARYDYLILLAAAVWGVAFYFQKTAMYHIGPLLFLGLRSGIAAIVLLPFAIRELRRPGAKPIEVLPIALVGGLVFFSAGATQQFGIVSATVINTGLLTALYVVVTPFVYWLVERQSPTWAAWISALIAFCGVWSLGGGTFGQFSDGDLLVAAASVGWGAHIVITGRAGKLARPITFTCQKLGLVGVVALASAVLFEPISASAIVGAIDSILYVALFSTALTFGIMAVALQHVPAPRASVILSTDVLFSSAAGYLLLDERLSSLGWLGGLLILAAVLIVRLRKT